MVLQQNNESFLHSLKIRIILLESPTEVSLDHFWSASSWFASHFVNLNEAGRTNMGNNLIEIGRQGFHEWAVKDRKPGDKA